MSDKFTWMHSGQIGAPQMNGAAGSNGQMLQVLDGCLINGFNPQTVTIATKTATTVTLTYGVSHGYELSQIIAVSGATDAALNGRHRVISKTATTVTIDAVDVAVTTGTITTKVAPLGWESIFGSADPLKRAYRSNDMQSSKTVLYLDMTLPAGHGYNTTNPAKRAMVSLCEDMTTLGVQINSYSDVENNYTVDPNGKLFWYQCRSNSKTSAVNESENRSWVIIGNGKFFYFFNEWQFLRKNRNYRDFYAFGDMEYLSGEIGTGNCGWVGSTSANDAGNMLVASVGAVVGGNPSLTTDVTGFMTTGVNGTGLMRPFVFVSSGFLAQGGVASKSSSGRDGVAENYPNPSTLSILGFPCYVSTGTNLRAKMPIMLNIHQNLGDNFSELDKLVSSSVLVVTLFYTRGSNTDGNGFFAFNLKG